MRFSDWISVSIVVALSNLVHEVADDIYMLRVWRKASFSERNSIWSSVGMEYFPLFAIEPVIHQQVAPFLKSGILCIVAVLYMLAVVKTSLERHSQCIYSQNRIFSSLDAIKTVFQMCIRSVSGIVPLIILVMLCCPISGGGNTSS